MPDADTFKRELEAAGLNPAAFARLVDVLSGQKLAHATVYRWCWGDRKVPPMAIAIVRMWARLPPTARETVAPGFGD